MKKSAICFALLAVVLCTNCYASSPPNRLSKGGAAVQEVAPFDGWNKLDLRSRNIYKDDPASKEWADVIIKVTGTLKPKQMKQLEKAGFRPGAVMNIIMTGKIQMARLADLVGLSFVEYVEAAMPLGLKKK